MEPNPSPAGRDFLYADNEADLAAAAQAASAASRAAIDTEADSLHHYHEKVCLLQMTVGGRNFLIDPLAGVDIQPLLAALARKTIILHGADYDLRMLRSSFGYEHAGTLIDTMIAAQLLGREQFGLASLIEQEFGGEFSKAGQKSDWSARPLSDSQLRYAVDDTRYLEPLADILLAQLALEGRLAWFEESCQAAIAAARTDRPIDPQRQWRIPGVRDLSARQAAFVQELWHWREEESQAADRPPFKILGNQPLMDLALWAEKDPEADFEHAPRLPRHFHGRRLRTLRAAIRRAAKLRSAQWPPPRLRGAPGPGKPGELFDQLRAAVARRAQELELPASTLAPRAAIEEISRRCPTDVDQLRQAGNLLHWQAEQIAPAVLEMLRS